MNCECIYFRKGAKKEELLRIGNAMECVSKRWGLEKNPVAISVITKDIVCAPNYDGSGKLKTISKGSVVLFVQGKVAYMCDVYGQAKNGKYNRRFYGVFPVQHEDDFFEDIVTEDEFQNHCKNCKINCGKGKV